MTAEQNITDSAKWERWPIRPVRNRKHGAVGFLIEGLPSTGLIDPSHLCYRTVVVASPDWYFTAATLEQCEAAPRVTYPSVGAMLEAGWE